MKGIEPSYAAWEAAVLPLNYIRAAGALAQRQPLEKPLARVGRIPRERSYWLRAFQQGTAEV